MGVKKDNSQIATEKDNDLQGKLIVEMGSGAGRFTEIFLKYVFYDINHQGKIFYQITLF